MATNVDLPPRLKESVANTKCTYRQLGKSGLRVSVPIFGCMSFGDRKALPWVVEEDEVRARGNCPLPDPLWRRVSDGLCWTDLART